ATIRVENQPVRQVTPQSKSHTQCAFNEVRILRTIHGPAQISPRVSVANHTQVQSAFTRAYVVIHTVAALTVDIPLGRLTAITGVSGSGKSTFLMETQVSALHAQSTPDPAMT